MIKKKYMCGILAGLLLLSITACGEREPSYADRETFPQETFVVAGDMVMTFQDSIVMDAYPTESAVGEWLTGCSDSDRNDQFDAYILRHEASYGNGNTVHTYLIYYPHGDKAYKATPELLEGESGYVINISYTAGSGVEGYSLCYLTVTLPTDKSPRVRLLVEDDSLGVLSTVTDADIPSVGEN
jgi:hypothetical protein